jgi:glutamate dehydrogenase (NAD(P)+)
MDDMFHFPVDLGPHKFIPVQEPSIHFQAILVVDNYCQKPGHWRHGMAGDVSTEACFHLARAMYSCL